MVRRTTSRLLRDGAAAVVMCPRPSARRRCSGCASGMPGTAAAAADRKRARRARRRGTGCRAGRAATRLRHDRLRARHGPRRRPRRDDWPRPRRQPPGAGIARRRHRVAGGRRDDRTRRRPTRCAPTWRAPAPTASAPSCASTRRQVAVVHAALAPSADELAWARRVLHAAEAQPAAPCSSTAAWSTNPSSSARAASCSARTP